MKQPPYDDTRFGAWLLEQDRRAGWIGDLARAALRDLNYPKHGSYRHVHMRVSRYAADGNMIQAVDAAFQEFAAENEKRPGSRPKPTARP